MIEAKVPVAILVRVSTTKQETNRQISELTSYATSKSYEVIKIADETISGRADDNDRHRLREIEELAQSGKIDEAGSEFLRAVRIRPNYAEARNNLGIVLARSGRLDEAIAHFEKALRDDPASAQIRANLRAALASRKASAEADGGRAGKSPSR